ncbi:MAG TPA: ABC transporter ATP-binding protein, partial [Beijerinckiaceae bacterium]|nr:ABC transporter ATP-binding protein [Beijerinckiaceae bacterium]
MERNPVRFVWKTTRALHAAAIGLLLLAIPVLWLGLDLVRVAIDDAIAGRAFAGQSTAPFLRVALTLPERIAEEPIVLLKGIPLERGKFVMATVAVLLGVALALSIGALLFGAIQSVAGARVLARLRRTIVDGIVGARPSARDDVQHAAALAGEGLAREGAFLGTAVLTPALGATVIAVALTYAGSVDWWLSVALVLTLLIIAFVWPRRLDALSRLSDNRLGEGAALRRLLIDLGRRLPAMRAHGTAGFERSRVSEDLAQRRQTARPAERDASAAAALTTLASAFVLVAIVAAGAWVGPARGITAGEMAAVLAAAAAAVLALDRMMDWQRALEASRRLFEEIARALGGFQSRGRGAHGGALSGSGALAAEGVAAYDPATGARITGVNLSIVMPAHVALVDGSGGAARVFAALIGGQIDPSVGRLTFAGADLPFTDPVERARRIAYAGGDTILIAGSLRQNLLYGCRDAAAADIEQRLLEAVTTAGLDG